MNETVLCVACMRENSAQNVRCQFCNAPLGLTVNPDPVQQLPTEGDIYSKAVESKPNLIVLIGTWLIFFVPMVFGFGAAVSMITKGGGGSSSFLFFWFLVAVGCFSSIMLYKVTRNYLKAKKRNW